MCRVYEPEVGRFVSADPIVQDIENLQAYNRYTYVQNNPLTLTDPSGFYAVDDFSGPGSYSSPNFLLMNDTASKVDMNTKSNLAMGSAPLRSNTDQETSGISSFRQSMQEQSQIRGATDSTASESGVFGNPTLGSPSSSASSNEMNRVRVASDVCFERLGHVMTGSNADGPFDICRCGGGGRIGGWAGRWERGRPADTITGPGVIRSMTAEQARKAVKSLQEIRARQNAIEQGKKGYGHLKDHKSVSSGKNFTQSAKEKIKSVNKERNNGELRSDKTGTKLDDSKQSKKGISSNPNEVNIDHRVERSQGGSNSFENGRVLSREENLSRPGR